MLISDKDALARINSPLNLLNRMRNNASNGNNKKNNAMNLFGVNKSPSPIKDVIEKPAFNPFEKSEALAVVASELSKNENETEPVETKTPETETSKEEDDKTNIENLVHNAEDQIKLAHAHDLALDTLTKSVEMMSLKLDDIKPDKLPSVIAATSKVVESIRRDRNEMLKSKEKRDVHYHFYTPVQKKMSEFEIIDVG